MTDLIKPRTQIIGKASFVPPLSESALGERDILKNVLTTDQSRYIDSRPISQPLESRSTFNRLPSLKKGAKKKDSERKSRVTAGMKALRESLPPDQLEPRINGSVLFPRSNFFTTVSAGDDSYDTNDMRILTHDSIYD